MGLATAYGPFRPAVYHSFVLREAGWAPQKGLPEHSLSKESKKSQRFTLLGGKKAICRGGGSRAQGLVRKGVEDLPENCAA